MANQTDGGLDGFASWIGLIVPVDHRSTWCNKIWCGKFAMRNFFDPEF